MTKTIPILTKTAAETNHRDYYCSMKFRYIKIDFESQNTYTCHAAKPHRIDFDWLKNNPGEIFNHDINVAERKMMLENQRNPSCEQNCWYAEDQGQISPRIFQRGYLRTHDRVRSNPSGVDITLGGDCNLSCSYCCKEFSSAWRQDIYKNGDYRLIGTDAARFQLNEKDKILMKISQLDLAQSNRYNTLINEVKMIAGSIQRLEITGGEPFLNNTLVDLLDQVDLREDSMLSIYTGLGVNSNRFNRILDQISTRKNFMLAVSGEGTGRFLEFNRFGVTWDQFERNLRSIIDRGIKFRFHSTITNLTIFGFRDFYHHYKDHDITVTFAYQPRMQAAHVMDDQSKDFLMESFSDLPTGIQNQISQTIAPDPTEIDRKNMSRFLSEFVKRRPGLDCKIYPESFLNWLAADVV